MYNLAKVGIIGGGVMGEVVASSLIRKKIFSSGQILVIDKNKSRIKQLKKKFGIRDGGSLAELGQSCRLIILAVKPKDFSDLGKSLKHVVSNRHLVISIMAGISIKRLQQTLGSQRIIRAMPNLAARINFGMTVWYAATGVKAQDKLLGYKIFSSFGSSLEVKKEVLVDSATAISGSGPAYYFYLAEYTEKMAKKIGFNGEQAEVLSRMTFLGAAKVYVLDKTSPRQLISQVSSKGGTTEAALRIFNEKGLGKIFSLGVIAAYQRALAIKKKYEQ